MESIYAALLLHRASKKVTAAAIEKVLAAAGVAPDNDKITQLVAGLKKKNIDEIIASAASAPMVAASGKGSGKSKKEAPKKEEKEEKVEAEPTGIGSLF